MNWTTMQSSEFEDSDSPRIFILSMRNLHKDVWRCAAYEFEDVICKVDNAYLYAPKPKIETNSDSFAKEFTHRFGRKIFYSPDSKKVELNRTYRCLFFVCSNLFDVQQIYTIRNWRKHFKFTVCWIEEIWLSQLSECRRYLNILSKFDHVIINFRGSLEVLKDKIPGQCHYSPGGIDAIRFCPYPDPPSITIDIFSLGRRPSRIHRSLLELAEEQKLFYFYDTLYYPRTPHPGEHRDLIANLAKRSKYFWVGPAKFNKPWETRGQIEFGHRFFEGAASGCVLIGEAPKCESFKQYFDWVDAIMPISHECEDLAQILSKLDCPSNNDEKIRKNNIVQSLLRHDWIYRWKLILDILGLKPKIAFYQRIKKLKKLADFVSEIPL